jgi:hypothetical protein
MKGQVARLVCRNPISRVCEDETHTPEMVTWKSSRTFETSESNCRGQKTLPWGVLYFIGKLSKCRCRKWARMTHLDICNTSYGKKKGQESNWQFDSWPLKVKNWPDPTWCVQLKCNTSLESSWGELQVCFRPHPNQRSEQGVMISQSPGSPNHDNFGTPPWESLDKKSFGCRCRGETQRILYGEGGGFPWV